VAITTYSELQTSVVNWLSRANLTNRIPEFIALCEARYGRELRVAGMEKRAYTGTAISTEYVQLPDDFMEARNFQLTTSPVTLLDQVSPDFIDQQYGGQIGKPKYYAIVGDEFQLAPAPDGEYTLELNYWAKIPALSDTNTSNWVLVNAPDIYLFGALCEAIPFIQDDKRITLWEQKYKMAISALQEDSNRRRWSSTAMQMRIAVPAYW
jgi:hypothetical protein